MVFDIVVIGGGAAGMMAAATAARDGAKVVLLEKNDRLGKKVGITGNGRCNVTNDCDVSEFLEAVAVNPHFLYSSLYGLTPEDFIKFLNQRGLPTKVEDRGRVFPVSDKSSNVIAFFESLLRENGVEIRFKSAVKGIGHRANDGLFYVEMYDAQTLVTRNCIIATGGISHPTTGSTGDGHVFAKSFGHKIVGTQPALVPLVCAEGWISRLMGISMSNVHLAAYAKGRKVFDGMGDVIFTHFGISGPLVLSASAYLAAKTQAIVEIDLVPHLSKDALDAYILQGFAKNPNRDAKNALHEILPKNFVPTLLELANIDVDKKIHSITKEERGRLVAQIKCVELNITGNRGFKEAMVTAGGIATKQICPSTMESKLVPGLFFAGEVMDVHALTGGYNLLIAFATGYLAGLSAKTK